jgi:beta-lactamase class A
MRTPSTRRVALAGSTSLLAALIARGAGRASPAAEAVFAKLERRSSGRLGVAILDTGSDRWLTHRANERFPMCSTFKALAVAAVLARVDAGRERLDRWVRFGRADLLPYAPITTARICQGGMTLGDLCAAAAAVSDNTAANLLVASLGGPGAVTAYARALGDGVTRLDRTEPALNEALRGDIRDTTTPAAMALDLRALLVGTALSAASRDRLVAWMVAATTGAKRIRAGLPAGWRAGDKTGSGRDGATNDVAILWPPGRKPILVAAYLCETAVGLQKRESVLADIGRIAATP